MTLSMHSNPTHRSGFEIAIAHVNDAAGVVGALILVAMLLIISGGVAMRYLFDNPITWSDQVASYGLVYVTFIGAPRVLARRGHVSVDILEHALAPRGRRWLQVFIGVIGMVYCLAFTALALREVQRLVERKALFFDAFEISQWVVYAVIPLGAALLFLQFVANFIEDLRLLRSHDQAAGSVGRS